MHVPIPSPQQRPLRERLQRGEPAQAGEVGSAAVEREGAALSEKLGLLLPQRLGRQPSGSHEPEAEGGFGLVTRQARRRVEDLLERGAAREFFGLRRDAAGDLGQLFPIGKFVLDDREQLLQLDRDADDRREHDEKRACSLAVHDLPRERLDHLGGLQETVEVDENEERGAAFGAERRRRSDDGERIGGGDAGSLGATDAKPLVDVPVWRPNAEALVRPKYFAKYREAGRLFRALRASALNDIRGCSSVADERAPSAKSPAGLEEAVRLHIVPLVTDDRELGEKSGDRYAYWLAKELIEPLIRRALEMSDPVERARALQEALLAQTTLIYCAHVARLSCLAVSTPKRQNFDEVEEAIERMLKLCNQVEKGRQKDERCRKRTTIESVARRALAKPVPRSDSSDSD